MASQITDNVSGTGMTGNGRFYAVATNQTLVVKSTPGRVCRVIVTAGTGAITIYDNASTASGNVIWTKATNAVGDSIAIDCPTTNGIVAVVAASTTANIIYS